MLESVLPAIFKYSMVPGMGEGTRRNQDRLQLKEHRTFPQCVSLASSRPSLIRLPLTFSNSNTNSGSFLINIPPEFKNKVKLNGH